MVTGEACAALAVMGGYVLVIIIGGGGGGGRGEAEES